MLIASILRRIQIDRNHIAALPGERHRKRQTHIAQADDPHGLHEISQPR